MNALTNPVLLLLTAWALSGCGGAAPPAEPTPHATPPATVLQVSDEMELATVRLTAQAEKRLGVTVAPIKKQEIFNRRLYPGVLVIPPQNQTPLLAPVAGTVEYIGPQPLAVGTYVSKGQTLFTLTPLQTKGDFALGPAQIDQLNASRIAVEQSAAAIKSRIDTGKVALEAARVEERRATQLLKAKVGSQRRVDEAKARVQLAEETVNVAVREQKTLRTVDVKPEPWSPTPLSQAAPQTGMIFRVQVSQGQSVSAGQPLLEIVDLSHILVRVRVPRGEASSIVRGEEAKVAVPGRDAQLLARAVKGPPTADPLTLTVDLYYNLENAALNPDQRVEVSLPLQGSGQHLVVPTGAIVYDVHGGAWVYVRTEPRVYRRRRVQVGTSDRVGTTVLVQGPTVGTNVVVDGAAEIFGVEFGAD